MERARLEDGKVIISSFREEYEFPVETLKAIAELKRGRFMLDQAMFYFNIFSNYKEHRWVKVQEVAEEDLTGWTGFYWYANYEDSEWLDLGAVEKFVTHSRRDDDVYYSVDVAGTEGDYSFNPHEEILLVKLSDSQFKEMADKAQERADDELRWERISDIENKVAAGETITVEEQEILDLMHDEEKVLRDIFR